MGAACAYRHLLGHELDLPAGRRGSPARIRAALYSGSANLTSEFGTDLSGNPRFVDIGDREIGDSEREFLDIESHIAEIVEKNARPLVLGGDHAISYPVVRAISEKHGPVNLLHFDAHPDLYDVYEGNRYSHACPFARIMEAGYNEFARILQPSV